MAKAEGLAILAEPADKGSKYDAGDDEAREDDDELDAMRDFLEAIDDKDPKAMKLAFARAYEACADKKADESGTEEEGY